MRAMSHLDILLPFALPPAELSADLCKALRTPALASLLARARVDRTLPADEPAEGFHRALPHERWLAQAFQGSNAPENNTSPPVAPALMRSFGLDPGAGTWFIVQPVHIHIARDHLVLTDPRQLMLSEQDARALFDIAAPLFEEYGKDLCYGNSDTWFIRADDWRELRTSTPDAASSHNIDIWMPRGPSERDWRKLQNEVQMHWFNHAINETRESHRLKPVNSLWLWGGAPEDTSLASNYTDTFNLSGWMTSFAAPKHAASATAQDVLAAKPQQGLVMLDTLLEPALSNDWSRWLDGMHVLEEKWFSPLLQALKNGAIDHLSLIATHDSGLSRFAVSRLSLRKFWVKPSLAPLCS